MTNLNQNDKTAQQTRGMSDGEILRQAKTLIDSYIVFLGIAHIGKDVLDADELPSARETLINAFRLVIAAENRAEIREKLLKLGLTLAQFQQGIGARMSLQPVGRNDAGADGEVLETMRVNHLYVAKFDQAFGAIGPERSRLAGLFRQSMEIAVIRNARRPDTQYGPATSSTYH